MSEDILPGNERISGKHSDEYAKMLKSEKPQDYNKQFSKRVKEKTDEITKHFDEVKKKILK